MSNLKPYHMFQLQLESNEDRSHYYAIWKDIPEMHHLAYFAKKDMAKRAAERVVLTLAERCAAEVKAWMATQRPATPQNPGEAERAYKNTLGARHAFYLEQRWKGADAEWNKPFRNLVTEPNDILKINLVSEFRYSYIEARSKAVVHPDGRIETTYFLAEPSEWSKWGEEKRGYYGARVPNRLRIEVVPVDMTIAGTPREVRR